MGEIRKRGGINIIDIAWLLIIIGLLTLFGYIIGKSTGLINSPIWVSYIPHMGGGLTLLGIALQSGKVLEKIKHIENNVIKMDGKVGTLVTDMASIKTTVNAHDISINKMDGHIVEIYKKGDTPDDKKKTK